MGGVKGGVVSVGSVRKLSEDEYSYNYSQLYTMHN